MKYPVYIKEKGRKLIYKAIDFLGMTECYRCIREIDGKEVHLFVGRKYLFSYDKEKWLTSKELNELNKCEPETKFEKDLIEFTDKLFTVECLKEKRKWKLNKNY